VNVLFKVHKILDTSTHFARRAVRRFFLKHGVFRLISAFFRPFPAAEAVTAKKQKTRTERCEP